MKLECTISCPEGVDFDVDPEDNYVCDYSGNGFQPRPLPKCLFPEVINGN